MESPADRKLHYGHDMKTLLVARLPSRLYEEASGDTGLQSVVGRPKRTS